MTIPRTSHLLGVFTGAGTSLRSMFNSHREAKNPRRRSEPTARDGGENTSGPLLLMHRERDQKQHHDDRANHQNQHVNEYVHYGTGGGGSSAFGSGGFSGNSQFTNAGQRNPA